MAELVKEQEIQLGKTIGSLAAKLERVEEKQNDLKGLKKEIKHNVRVLEAKGRSYDKIRLRADEKPSARNLNKLNKAESELEFARDSMLKSVKDARDTVASVSKDCESVSEFYHTSGNRSKAKKYGKMAERIYSREEAEIEKMSLSVSEYTLGAQYEEPECNEAEASCEEVQTTPAAQTTAQNKAQSQAQPQQPQNPFQNQFSQYPPFYFLPTYCDPTASQGSATVEVTDELRDAIKEAVKECVTPMFAALEAKILDAMSEIKVTAVCEASANVVAAPEEAEIKEEPMAEVVALPSTESVAAISSEIKKIIESLENIVLDAENINKKVGEISEAQRAVIDMQRSFARDMQGVQVKQKLVNADQAELVEAQEVVLQHQKLIKEQHEAIFAKEDESLAAISDILAKQGEVEAEIKSTIQTQKSIIQANVKNNELQRELIEKQGDLVIAQREVAIAQKQLSKAIKGRKKAESTDSEPQAESQPESQE